MDTCVRIAAYEIGHSKLISIISSKVSEYNYIISTRTGILRILLGLFTSLAFVQSGKWPMQWKIEYTTPIGKIHNPEDEYDLRPISLTPF